MYINTIIVASTNAVGFIIASSLVNVLGKKVLLGIARYLLRKIRHFVYCFFSVIMYGMCAIAGIGNYWSAGMQTTLFFASMHGGVAGVCTSTMISVIVDLFPTTLR